MNRITRNLAIVFLLAVSSLIAVAVLIFIELRLGQPIFTYTVYSFVPAGAIAAGLLAASGFYLGSLALKLRPAKAMFGVVVLLAIASVFAVDSVDYGLMTVNRKSITDASSFGNFMTYAMTNNPLIGAFTGHNGSSGSSSGSSGSSGLGNAAVAGAAPVASQVSNDSNSNVAGIGGGVSGMLATGNALSADNVSSSMSGMEHRMEGLQSVASGVVSHAWVLELAGLQLLGFALGGLLACYHLRSLAFCDDCLLFLSRKGTRTRYFDRERDIYGMTDEFLSKAKIRRYQQSVEAHSAGGAAEKKKTTEFAATVEVSQCKGCHRHKLKFSAKRKKGMTWKDIKMLGYETFCMEPIHVLQTTTPTRIR
jgi:hypothetical protein